MVTVICEKTWQSVSEVLHLVCVEEKLLKDSIAIKPEYFKEAKRPVTPTSKILL